MEEVPVSGAACGPGGFPGSSGDIGGPGASEAARGSGALRALGPNPVLVLGLSPGGLYLVRALAEAGIPVYGVTHKNESGIYSKYLGGGRGWKNIGDGELIRRIAGLAETHGAAPLLLPSSDRYIEWISEHYGELEPVARFSKSYRPDRYARLLDKDLFYKACEGTGVPYPRRLRLADFLAGAVAGAGRPIPQAGGTTPPLNFPLLIKPGRLHEVTDVMGSRKVFVCRDEDELRSRADRLPKDRGGWLVQEIVEGPDDAIYCLGGVHRVGTPASREQAGGVHTGGGRIAARIAGIGRIKARIAGRKLRQFPAGFGTAAALRLESPPDHLWKDTAALLDALEVDGIFEIEFKLDSRDGLWKVFEINPRTALWFGAARAAGVPLAETAYSMHTGCEPAAAAAVAGTETGSGQEGRPIVWRTGLKNIIAVGAGTLRGQRRRVGMTGKAGRKSIPSWAFWEADDPFPLHMELVGYFGKVVRRVWKKMGGRIGGRKGIGPAGRRGKK